MDIRIIVCSFISFYSIDVNFKIKNLQLKSKNKYKFDILIDNLKNKEERYIAELIKGFVILYNTKICIKSENAIIKNLRENLYTISGNALQAFNEITLNEKNPATFRDQIFFKTKKYELIVNLNENFQGVVSEYSIKYKNYELQSTENATFTEHAISGKNLTSQIQNHSIHFKDFQYLIAKKRLTLNNLTIKSDFMKILIEKIISTNFKRTFLQNIEIMNQNFSIKCQGEHKAMDHFIFIEKIFIEKDNKIIGSAPIGSLDFEKGEINLNQTIIHYESYTIEGQNAIISKKGVNILNATCKQNGKIIMQSKVIEIDDKENLKFHNVELLNGDFKIIGLNARMESGKLIIHNAKIAFKNEIISHSKQAMINLKTQEITLIEGDLNV